MEKQNKKDKTIKHLVISGGGPAGFSFYGAIKECHCQNLWTLENIESMYGTSIGAILCVILCLDYEWQVLDDFLIKRPWKQVFPMNMYTIIDSFQKRGIYDIKVIENAFLPLFAGKDISIDITLQEFYELNHIDLHFFSTEIHKFELIDFSHKTYPNWRLVDAVYCSCSLPVAFSPLLRDDRCYCDGGVISNYPLRQCIEGGADPDEILGIKMTIDRVNQSKVHSESSIFDYIIAIFNKIMEKRLSLADLVENPIAYEFKIESPQISIYGAYSIVSSQEERARLIEFGQSHVVAQLLSS